MLDGIRLEKIRFDKIRKFGVAAAIATTILAGGLAGCSSMSADHVDCNVVKLQQQSGRSDSEIAAAVGAPIADVEACHGAEKSGNKSSGGVPDTY